MPLAEAAAVLAPPAGGAAGLALELPHHLGADGLLLRRERFTGELLAEDGADLLLRDARRELHLRTITARRLVRRRAVPALLLPGLAKLLLHGRVLRRERLVVLSLAPQLGELLLRDPRGKREAAGTSDRR